MTRLAAPPAGSRSRRATFSYGSMILFILVTTVTGLVITPRLVAALGAERFGAARILVDYAGYLALLDLGLGGALSPLFSRALATGDEKSLRGTMAAGLRLYGRIAATVLAIGLGLTPFIPRLVNAAPALAHDVRWAWACCVLGMLALAVSPFRALVDAEQRGYLVNLLYTCQGVGIALLSLALALAGWGVTGQTMATAAVTGGVALVIAMLSLRRHPGLLHGLREPSDPEARAALKKLSGPTLTVSIAGRMSVLSDNIVLGLILHPAAVTMLFVTQRLATLAQLQLMGVGGSSWAALAELHGRGEIETFNRRLVELTRMIAILGMATLGPIVAFNSQFLALWMGPARDAGTAVVLVASANALAVSVLSLWYWVFTATGRIGLIVRATVLSAAINVAASVACTLRFGVVGPLLGTLIASLSVPAWYTPMLLREHFGTSMRKLALAVAVPILAGAPYMALLWWLARGRPAPGWIGLAAEMAGSSALYLAFSVTVLMSPADRAIWRARLGGLLPRRAPGADE